MKNHFSVDINEFTELTEIEGSRNERQYSEILEIIEYGDTEGMSETDKFDVISMHLQDLEPHEAAELILQFDFKGVLSDGQIRNISNEMPDEKLWEEYADLALHERFFITGSLLYRANPQAFPKTDAARISLKVSPLNVESKEVLGSNPSESFWARLISDGMEQSSILHRMFENQITGKSFPEADKILWTVVTNKAEDGSVIADVTSSGNWLDPMRDALSYESHAYEDPRD